MNEAKQIKKAVAGDSDAFAALVQPYEEMLFRYAYRMVKNEDDAADCLQESLIKAFRNLSEYRAQAKFSTWLYTILNRTCLDFLRKHQRTTAKHVSLFQQSGDNEDYELQIEDPADSPFDVYRKKSVQTILADAIMQLPDEQRAVVTLRDIEGLEYERIAQVLELSVGTVKSRLSRGRLNLRKILEPYRELFLH